MFSEVVRIKPILDSGAAKSMEQNLSSRFSRVAKRFGGGLRAVIKGSILGISVGLLSRLLNPLEALEEKIKSLLGQSTDIRDLAERFGTTPGELRRLQDVASSLGVAPEKLNEVLGKYAETVEQARKELKDPFQERSDATKILAANRKDLVDETNIASSFIKFLQAARAQTPEARAQQEELVLGGRQFGGVRRLIDTDIEERANDLKLSSADALTRRILQTAANADLQSFLGAQNRAADFIKSSEKIGPSTIQQLESKVATEDARLREQLGSYDNLRQAANGVDLIKEQLIRLNNAVLPVFGTLGVFLNRFMSGGGPSFSSLLRKKD